MKKLLLSAFVAFAMLASTKTLAQQGFGTNTPSKTAAVDIVSTQRGLLIPRLNLVATDDEAPIASTPAQSLLVYNNATAGSGLTAVSPGFYYWDTNRWVRIVSTATEKNTTVKGGNNVLVDSDLLSDGVTTQYTVSVEGGNNGQVLVTVPNPSYDSSDPDSQQYISDWVNPEDFISSVLQEGNAIDITKDSTTGKVNVKFDGNLTEDTTIATGGTYDLAITGLPTLTTVGSEKVMIMDTNGILKQVSLSDLLAAKDLTLGDGLNFEAGDGVGAVLKDTKIEIKDKSVTAEKLVAKEDGTDENKIPVANANGSVEYKDASTAIGQPLTTDGIIGIGATSGTINVSNTIDGAVLTPTYLKIKENSISALQIGTDAVGNDELAPKVVTADKMESKDAATGTNAPDGTVPTADGLGSVKYETIADASGHTLTTDGKITVLGGTTATTMDKAVLVPTSIAIAPESITSADILNGTIESTDIKDGTITTTDIQAPGSTTNEDGDENMVMVTDTNGDVKWIAQSELPSNTKLVNGTNTTITGTGATTPNEYKVNVATASGTTLGVVKQSAATGEEITIAADGSLSINEANVNVGLDSNNAAQGDVSGTLSNLTVGAIQGIPVSDVDPTSTNNMLVFQNGRWEPSTVARAAGKTLTGDGITVTAGTKAGTDVSLAASVLADVTLAIADDAITSEKIEDGEVKTADLANTSVTAGKLVADLNGSDVNKIPVANANGSVEYKDAAAALGKQLSSTSITVSTLANKALLQDLNIEIKPGTAANQILTTVDNAGALTTEWATPNSLVTVDNGLNKDNTDIELGGVLKRTTVITTGVNSTNDPTPVNTLGLQGLIVPATASTEIMYAEGTTGVLRKAARSVSQYIEASQVVSTITGYNDFVQEVNITAKIVSGDINVTLPAATATNKGQVVNVKITNTAEVADYLNILVGSTTLTYGALPYQSWIIKSNGTSWEIVGRN